MATINEKHHSRQFKSEREREIQFDGSHIAREGINVVFSTVLPVADDYKHRDIRITLSAAEAEHLRDSLTRMLNAKQHTAQALTSKRQ